MKENLTIKYETVQQTARRLNVTPRTIQKWAKEGKIDGAVLVGRSYIIPADTDFSSVIEKKLTEKKLAQASAKPYLPLVGGSYPLGKSGDYINSITLPNRRKLAQAEQYYYSGQSRKTSEQHVHLGERLYIIVGSCRMIRFQKALLCLCCSFHAHQNDALYKEQMNVR